MKELTKKGIALASAGMVAISCFAFSASAMAVDPDVLDPTDPDDAALILDNFSTLALQKTIHANESVDTAGITYTFDFQPAAPFVNSQGDTEEGAFAVPAGVDIDTITLTAAAMSGNSQVLSDYLTLPDPDDFLHAGVYAFTVEEAVSNVPAADASNWTNDQSKFKVRLYVKNGTESTTTYALTSDQALDGNKTYYVSDGQGGYTEVQSPDVADIATYYEATTTTSDCLIYDKVTIEQIESETDQAMSEKKNMIDFDNTYNALSDLEIKKLVSGDYANKAYQFDFDVTLTFPDYIAVGTTYNYTDVAGQTQTVTVGNDHTAAITGLKLSDAQSIKFDNIPVGTLYSVTENDPSEGVNNYVPSAVYFYDGAANARTGFGDNSNTVQAGTAGSDYTVQDHTAASMNQRTAVGLGDGNIVTVTNTLDNPPSPTGVLVENLPFALVLAIPAILAGIAIASRKRIGEDA